MISEEFLYEYIRNENKFYPTLPVPFKGNGRFLDIYLEEIMDWILVFYEDARANNSNYGGPNARYDPDAGILGDPDYEPHFDIYFSEDLFNNIIPVEADIAQIAVPELDWYNPTPRDLNITDIQDFDSLIYSIPYPPRVSKVIDEETGIVREEEREPCSGIAQSDVRFLRLYVYDIARELVNAINMVPPNVIVRGTSAFIELVPEINLPKFTASGRNLPVDLDIQSIRPYIGFVMSLYDNPKKEITQHFTLINLIDLINHKELNRQCYYGVYDVLDMDGRKFNYTKIFYDGYTHFLFIGQEEGDNATPGVLITNISLLPLIKLQPITETFTKIFEYIGIQNIKFLGNASESRYAYLPDADLGDELATYASNEIYDFSKYIYNSSNLDSNDGESASDFIFNHLVVSGPQLVTIDCFTKETQSVGGFPGAYNDNGVNGLWTITASPQILVDDKYDVYCFKTVDGLVSCSDSSDVWGYDFALIGRLLNKEERGEEEETTDDSLTEEERAEQEAVAQAVDDNNRPFKPKKKEDYSPWELAVIEDEARIPTYGTIHPDPRKIHLWGYGFDGPLGCFGLQELRYASSMAAFEYNRRIATNFNQGRKDLLLIGDPYTSKAKWKSALNNWNKSQGGSTTSDFPTTSVVTDEEKQRVEDTLLVETDFLLMSNGIVPIDPESTLEPMIWTVQCAGRAKNFAKLKNDVDENGNLIGDGHTKRLSIANFHDPVFITATDAYREPINPEDINKDYTSLQRRRRSISLRVWPRTLPCVQHLGMFELDEPKNTNYSSPIFGNFSKEISNYPIFGVFPAFFVSGLRSNLEIKITDSGDSDNKTACLDAFANGYSDIDEFNFNESGLKSGLDSGIQFDFDDSVTYDFPLSHLTNDVYHTFGVEYVNEWVMYMWGKQFGISTLNIRDYIDYNQDAYSPEVKIVPRSNLLNIEVYLWTVENIPTNVTISSDTPKQFELQIKGIVSHPLIWATTDNSIARIQELPSEDSSGGGSDVATTLVVTDEGTSVDDQMNDDGPRATLTVYKPGKFRVVVMDSARIPFISYEVDAKNEGSGPTTTVVNP